MQALLLVTAPNNSDGKTYEKIASSLSSSFGDQVKLHRFEMPIKQLTVGTLDSLIALSDDLQKINSATENVVRKIERQFFEIIATMEGDAVDASLRVNEISVEAYLKNFKWDFSKYQVQGKPLTELVGHIQSVTAKSEEELKILATNYADKTVALSAVQRKRVINLQTSDFEDFLQEDDIAKLDMQDSENLVTVMVVVPRSFDKEFLKEYDSTLGGDIACFGGIPDWSGGSGSSEAKGPTKAEREAVKGSPVVPGSIKKVKEEGDSILYSITVLRGHYETGVVDMDGIYTSGPFVDYLAPLKVSYREKKCLVRDFSFDDSKAGGLDVYIERAVNDLQKVKNQALRWCKAHFGEAFIASIHLKMVRGFVESVLRYGLPVNFISFFLENNLKSGREKEFTKTLSQVMMDACPEILQKKLLVGGEEEEEGEGEGEAAGKGDNLPYVCHPFQVVSGKQ